MITRTASERIAQYAFAYARANNRKRVTVVHKADLVCSLHHPALRLGFVHLTRFWLTRTKVHCDQGGGLGGGAAR